MSEAIVIINAVVLVIGYMQVIAFICQKLGLMNKVETRQ